MLITGEVHRFLQVTELGAAPPQEVKLSYCLPSTIRNTILCTLGHTSTTTIVSMAAQVQRELIHGRFQVNTIFLKWFWNPRDYCYHSAISIMNNDVVAGPEDNVEY